MRDLAEGRRRGQALRLLGLERRLRLLGPLLLDRDDGLGRGDVDAALVEPAGRRATAALAPAAGAVGIDPGAAEAALDLAVVAVAPLRL